MMILSQGLRTGLEKPGFWLQLCRRKQRLFVKEIGFRKSHK